MELSITTRFEDPIYVEPNEYRNRSTPPSPPSSPPPSFSVDHLPPSMFRSPKSSPKRPQRPLHGSHPLPSKHGSGILSTLQGVSPDISPSRTAHDDSPPSIIRNGSSEELLPPPPLTDQRRIAWPWASYRNDDALSITSDDPPIRLGTPPLPSQETKNSCIRNCFAALAKRARNIHNSHSFRNYAPAFGLISFMTTKMFDEHDGCLYHIKPAIRRIQELSNNPLSAEKDVLAYCFDITVGTAIIGSLDFTISLIISVASIFTGFVLIPSAFLIDRICCCNCKKQPNNTTLNAVVNSFPHVWPVFKVSLVQAGESALRITPIVGPFLNYSCKFVYYGCTRSSLA